MTGPEDLENNVSGAKALFAGPCDFVLGVAELEQLPEADRPEFAFAGRSNVGKSSLVNALVNRKNLVKTSATPGRTQQLNFFDLGGVLYLVDMPGYGYAKVAKTERRNWQKLIRAYLRGRPNLRCVFILVDARHGFKDSDHDLMKMLDETAVAYRVVLTKGDKRKGSQEKLLDDMQTALKKHPAAFPEILMTSAAKKTGLEDLQAAIIRLAS